MNAQLINVTTAIRRPSPFSPRPIQLTLPHLTSPLLVLHLATTPIAPVPHHHQDLTITRRHTHTLGRTPLDERSARRRDL
jgi:hypothetical protein